MKISTKKRITKGVGFIGASVAVLGAVLPTLDIFADADSVMTPTFGGESNNNIRNPDRGFYFPIYVDGSNLDTFDQNAFSSNLAAMSQSYPYMSIIQVNINAAEIIGLVENRTVSFHHISDSRLQNLEKIFTAIRNNGFKAIVNFDAITYDGMNSSYKMKLDYNGYGFETAFMADMVETAIKDITPILVANDDIIMMTSDGCSGSDFSQDEYSSMYRKLYVSSTWREDQYKTLTTSATSISDQVTLASVKAMAEDYVKADRELVTRATMSQLRPDNAGNTAWKDDGWLATYTPWSLTMCKDGQFEDEYRSNIISGIYAATPNSIMVTSNYVAKELLNTSLNPASAFSGSNLARTSVKDFIKNTPDEIANTNALNLDWVKNQSKYTFFGGSPYIESDDYSIESYLDNMALYHMQYSSPTFLINMINGDYSSSYTDTNSVFNGVSYANYYEAHLGYRLVLRDADVSVTGNNITASIDIENVGFGDVIAKNDIYLVLKDANGETFDVKSGLDLRTTKDTDGHYRFEFTAQKPKYLNTENYTVYLKLAEPSASIGSAPKYTIQLANENIYDQTLGANLLGTIEESNTTSPTTSYVNMSSNGSLIIDLHPNGENTFGAAKDNVQVESNADSYSLYLSMAGSNQNLQNTNSSAVIAPVAENSLLTANTWGYSTDSDVSASSNFNPIPAYGSEVLIKTVDNNNGDSMDHSFSIGAMVSPNLESGVYTNSILYTALADHTNSGQAIGYERGTVSPLYIDFDDASETANRKATLNTNYVPENGSVDGLNYTLEIGDTVCTDSTLSLNSQNHIVATCNSVPTKEAGAYKMVLTLPDAKRAIYANLAYKQNKNATSSTPAVIDQTDTSNDVVSIDTGFKADSDYLKETTITATIDGKTCGKTAAEINSESNLVVKCSAPELDAGVYNSEIKIDVSNNGGVYEVVTANGITFRKDIQISTFGPRSVDPEDTVTPRVVRITIPYNNSNIDASNVSIMVGSGVASNISVVSESNNKHVIQFTAPMLSQGIYQIKLKLNDTNQTYTADNLVYAGANNPFGIKFMQEMTAEVCSSVATPDQSVDDVPEAILLDVRDGNPYVVRKMADGNCWMAQNLDYAINATIPMTAEDTDLALAEGASYTPSEDTWVLQDDTDALHYHTYNSVFVSPTNGVVKSDTTELSQEDSLDFGYVYFENKATHKTYSGSLEHLVGNAYNYYAFTAGTYDSNQSICPKGWTLPSTDQLSALIIDNYGGWQERPDPTYYGAARYKELYLVREKPLDMLYLTTDTDSTESFKLTTTGFQTNVRFQQAPNSYTYYYADAYQTFGGSRGNLTGIGVSDVAKPSYIRCVAR